MPEGADKSRNSDRKELEIKHDRDRNENRDMAKSATHVVIRQMNKATYWREFSTNLPNLLYNSNRIVCTTMYFVSILVHSETCVPIYSCKIYS